MLRKIWRIVEAVLFYVGVGMGVLVPLFLLLWLLATLILVRCVLLSRSAET